MNFSNARRLWSNETPIQFTRPAGRGHIPSYHSRTFYVLVTEPALTNPANGLKLPDKYI